MAKDQNDKTNVVQRVVIWESEEICEDYEIHEHVYGLV
jgi:hypothetical protein